MKLSALMILIFLSPASAGTSISEKMCSTGFDAPAYLLSVEDGYELHVGSSVELLVSGGSVGTGLNGQVVSTKNKTYPEVIYITEIIMDANQTPPDARSLLIFRDRVFWPCTTD